MSGMLAERSGNESWCVVGLTPATTGDGRSHVDGSACVITEHDIVALAEERASGRAHQGGSELALRAVLAAVGRTPAMVDRWVLTSCGEPLDDRPELRALGSSIGATLADLGVEPESVRWLPSHHLSHALSARPFVQPGDLILVADDVGTDLGAGGGPERATAYLVDRRLRPVVIDVLRDQRGGIGTLYREVTDVLGLDGYTDCGKTMALAAYRRPDVRGGPAPGRGHPMAAPEFVLDTARAMASANDGARWTRGERAWGDGHAAAAALVQEAAELAVVGWTQSLISQLPIPPPRIACAGGLFLNCRAVGILCEAMAGVEVLVCPWPGDTGQALGNAIAAALDLGRPVPPGAASPYLGPWRPSDETARALEVMRDDITVVHRDRAVEQATAVLEQGGLLGLFEGRSEFGPRALGHRSILADPRRPGMREHLNEVKGREQFRPFGVAAFDDVATRIAGRAVRSPAMLIAHRVTASAAKGIPAGVHVDGTCRLQTVGRTNTDLIAGVLAEWERRSGLGALLNTSFNAAGRPIVETLADAVRTGRMLGLDAILTRSACLITCLVL